MSEAAQAAPGTRELDRAPDPDSSVRCPLKQGAQIGMGRCVEWQRDNGCHCENALVALRRVGGMLSGRWNLTAQESPADAAARAEQLDEVRGLIARAEQIERERPVQPAKEQDVSHLTERTCGWKESPCSEKLGATNKSGLCNPHNSVMYARKKAAEKSGDKAARAAPAVARPRAPRVAPPAPTNSDPGPAAHDEFERMRRIIEDYQALSREGRLYVSGRLSTLTA